MKQRKQIKILARSSKTNVVLFVIQLPLLFDKTESCEPGEPSDSTDSTDSMTCPEMSLQSSKPKTGLK
jgi:hypothetical protein